MLGLSTTSKMTISLDRVKVDDAVELACKAHLGVWAERKRGYVNAALHWEWCELAMSIPRLCVVAPREHAKSEVFTVGQVVWRCTYEPGIWCYVFGATGDLAARLKERIDLAMGATSPWMMKRGTIESNKTMSIYANGSRVDVAGAGKAVRGVHPDLIVGDDVLEEGNSMTSHQRKVIGRWWSGTVGGMSHPGTTREVGTRVSTRMVTMPPTKVHLVGTPFHQQDLLMSMAQNPMYEFRRYAAEFDPMDLVPGSLAVQRA